MPPGTLARNTGAVWLDTPDRVLPLQRQASIGYERQIGRQLSFAADYMHIQNRNQPLRYNLNPAIKQTTGRTAPITRVDFSGVAGQLGLTKFASDVCIVEYIGETEIRRPQPVRSRSASPTSGARRFWYALGKGAGNTNGTPTATNNFQVLDERNLELNEGPTNADRRHAVTLSGRVRGAMGSRADRWRRRAVR